MNTTQTGRKLVMAAAIIGTAASALLSLGSGSALAVQGVSEGTPGDAINTLMMVTCPVTSPPKPQSPCGVTPSLSWWPELRPAGVVAQGWLEP